MLIGIPASLEDSIKFTVTATTCTTDGTTTCNETVTQVINGNITCASLSLAVVNNADGTVTVNWIMPAVSTPIDYTVSVQGSNGVQFLDNGSSSGGALSWVSGSILTTSDSIPVTATLIIQQNGQTFTSPCSVSGTVSYP